MGLQYTDLDDVTRAHMVAEYERDLAEDNIYISVRLSPQGVEDWPELLRTALAEGTDETLAAEIALCAKISTLPGQCDDTNPIVKTPAICMG